MTATIADTIYQSLSQRIVTGDLPAGEKLRQDHIAREFETSHVPVREALLRLEAHGLAQSIPRRGTRVSALDPREIQEIIEMRVSLELLALRHAFSRMTDADIATADEIRMDCDAAETMVEWESLNRQFHRCILTPCNMPRLLAAIDDLHIAASRHLFANWRHNWRKRPDKDHAALIGAMARRDHASASDILRRHLRRVT